VLQRGRGGLGVGQRPPPRAPWGVLFLQGAVGSPGTGGIGGSPSDRSRVWQPVWERRTAVGPD
jgi:hypothetical protein